MYLPKGLVDISFVCLSIGCVESAVYEFCMRVFEFIRGILLTFAREREKMLDAIFPSPSLLHCNAGADFYSSYIFLRVLANVLNHSHHHTDAINTCELYVSHYKDTQRHTQKNVLFSSLEGLAPLFTYE